MVRHIRKERYFTSEEFLAHKAQMTAVVAEHNQVAQYTSEIRRRGSFSLGASSTGAQANLASFENTSNWNYRRDRYVPDYAAPNVHNCSLQVVRNASADPLKYLMKYFNIRPTEDNLTEVETLGEEISRLENAVFNLYEREQEIASSINPPAFILRHYRREFMERVGVKLSPITVPYPQYAFEYVSAGGNSSQSTTIELNTQTIDELVMTLSRKIRWRKSAAGQRALMTAKLREYIKTRDKHTCQDQYGLLCVSHSATLSSLSSRTFRRIRLRVVFTDAGPANPSASAISDCGTPATVRRITSSSRPLST